MPIDGITMQKPVWDGALGAPDGLDGVKSVRGDGAVRISHVDGKGATTSITIECPRLDAPAAYSVAALEDLVAGLGASSPFQGTPAERKLMLDILKATVDEAAKEHSEIAGGAVAESGPQSGASKALFDVFAILKLMLVVAQKTRNALREQRQAENAAVQKAIKDQAEDMVIAAWAGVGAAVAAGLIQGVLLGIQAYRFSSSVNTRMELQDASATSAAKTNLNTAKLAANETKARENLENLGKRLEPDGLTSVKDKVNASFREKCNGTEDGSPLKKIEDAAAALKEDPQNSTLRDNLEAARNEYCEGIDKVEFEYKKQYEAARVNYRDALKSGDKGSVKAAKVELNAAQSEYEYAHAAALQAKIEQGGMARADVAKTYVLRDGAAVDSAYGELRFDDEYTALDNHFEWLRIGNTLIQTVGQVLGSAASQVSPLINAKAHRYGAVEQEARNELDQINDLFNNCQKLLETVLQVVQAVIQAESQSVDSAISGLRG